MLGLFSLFSISFIYFASLFFGLKRISAVAAMPRSDLIASGAGSGIVKLWRHDAASGQLAQCGAFVAPARAGFVNALAFAPNSTRLLAAALGTEHKLGRWETARSALNQIHLIQLHGGDAHSVDDDSHTATSTSSDAHDEAD